MCVKNCLVEKIAILGTVSEAFPIKIDHRSILFIKVFTDEYNEYLINVPIYSCFSSDIYNYLGKKYKILISKYTFNNISRYKLLNISENVKDFL